MMTVYIIAAEPSGDAVGAELMRGLSEATAGGVKFEGIGGPAMAAQGLVSRFDMSELTLLGVFEVLPKAAGVLSRVRETVTDIEALNPDVVLTIDAWGFTGRVHKALTKRGSTIPRVRAVAPQVWAWRAGRARQLANWIDHLLTLFAFEPPLFERHGLASTWIGHPVMETGIDSGDGLAFRRKHGLSEDQVVLGVLPGSRKREVRTLLPIFRDAVQSLELANLVTVVPLASGVSELARAGLSDWPTELVIVESDEKAGAFAAMNGALAASGTVTLELALARVPHVIAYKLNWLSGQVVKRMATTEFANMVNVMEQSEVVPELLMARCNAQDMRTAILELMSDLDARNGQLSAFERVEGQLSRGGTRPGTSAAHVILELVNRRAA